MPPHRKDLTKTSDTSLTHRRDFVKVEKNLSTLGFFTPSKSRGKIELVEKTIRFKREVNGKTVEAEATILPSAKYGLPTTADLDKYLAFQKILNDIRVREGQVSNPIGFSSTQMLNVLGVKTAFWLGSTAVKKQRKLLPKHVERLGRRFLQRIQ